jgi:hypothetical protein
MSWVHLKDAVDSDYDPTDSDDDCEVFVSTAPQQRDRSIKLLEIGRVGINGVEISKYEIALAVSQLKITALTDNEM